MNLLKSLAYSVFLGLSFVAHAHDGVPNGCQAAWSRPEGVTIERPILFRGENYVVTDRHAKISGLEGYDCSTGFTLQNLEIVSDLPELGAFRGGFNCAIDFESYAETHIPNYDFLREVVSGPSAPGILEVRLIGDSCSLRYHESLSALRAQFQNYSCNGRIDVDDRVSCQHIRHLKKRN